VVGNTLSIALKTTTSESVFIIPGHKKDRHLFSTVKNKIFIKQNATNRIHAIFMQYASGILVQAIQLSKISWTVFKCVVHKEEKKKMK
jgi:hypothetical protein